MKHFALLLLCFAACTTSRTVPDDGSVADGGHDGGRDGSRPDAGDCLGVDCIGVPMGCTYVDNGTCCGTFTCPDDAGVDASCAAIDCIAPPLGCTYVDDGTCCGTYSCPDDGGVDAGCPLPPCAAPPPGCYYVGAACGTCGTIVCPDASPTGDCRTTGCPTGETCRPCGVPGPGGIPYSCVADGVVCGL